MDFLDGIESQKLSLVTQYSDEYRLSVFTKWFLSGKPSSQHLRKLIDPDPVSNLLPRREVLEHWIRDDFTAYAIELDQEISKRIEQQLIERKVEALNRHADLGRKMQNIGVEYLDQIEDVKSIGIRNAINLLVKGVEMERESAVIPGFFSKISKMDDETLLDEIKKLAENSPVIDFGANVDEEDY